MADDSTADVDLGAGGVVVAQEEIAQNAALVEVVQLDLCTA